MKNKTIIFVHPALWVGMMIAEAKKLGYLTFAIITTFEKTKINPKYLYEHCDFVLNGSSNPEADLDKIEECIKKNSLEVCAIINGIDASIYYTDFLQKAILGYPIDLKASKIRLNKYEVNQQLEKYNLPSIPGVEIKNLKEYKENISIVKRLDLPVIIKPTENTAAYAGVKIAETIEQIPKYIENVLGSSNPYYKDQIINKVIIQKYLSIKKYKDFAFDFISFSGEHRCIGILEHWKNQFGVVEAGYTYIANELPNVESVIDYVRNCLNALKVSYGFTHTEIFWDQKGKEYYVIEINNRCAGFPTVPCFYNIYENGPLTNYFKLMNNKYVEAAPNNRVCYCIYILLYNFHVDYPTKLELGQLESKIVFKAFRAKDKKKLSNDFYKNYDLPNQVGAVVILSSSSKNQLLHDFRTLKNREKEGGLFL